MQKQPFIVATVQCLGVGVVAGLTALGFEEVANAAIGEPSLAWSEFLRLLGVYAAVGAVCALPAVRVQEGGGRLMTAVIGLAGLVFATYVGSRVAGRGLPFALGFGGVAIGAMVGCAVMLRFTRSRPAWRWGLGAALGALVPAFMAVNHNAFGSPMERGALIADAVMLVLAGSFGLVVARVARRGASSALAGLVILPWLVVGPWRALTRTPLPEPAKAGTAAQDIVLVIIDTLRADHLGTYGYSRPTSPNIDAFAAGGLLYTQVTSAAPWTLPSFGSLLTGLLPQQHGAGINVGDKNTNAPLRDDVPTLAQRMAAAGYRTGALVTNGYIKRLFGLHRGFDTYDDALGLGHPMMLLDVFGAFDLPVMEDRHYRTADRMTDVAIRWWEATAGGPRFLLLHYMEPHRPYRPPRADRRLAETWPDVDLPDPSYADEVRVYDAEIHFVDREFRRALDAFGPNTTVLLTSDHGHEFADHAGAYPRDQHLWPSTVRHGHTLYQEQLFVPLIVSGPGVLPGRIDRPVRSIDVVPTVLELAQAAPIEGAAEPLTEVLGRGSGSSSPARSQALLYGTEKRSVRFDRWKLIDTEWGPELYDLTADPFEQQDLAASMPDRVSELTTLLPAAGTGEMAELDAATRQQLEALGYVQ